MSRSDGNGRSRFQSLPHGLSLKKASLVSIARILSSEFAEEQQERRRKALVPSPLAFLVFFPRFFDKLFCRVSLGTLLLAFIQLLGGGLSFMFFLFFLAPFIFPPFSKRCLSKTRVIRSTVLPGSKGLGAHFQPREILRVRRGQKQVLFKRVLKLHALAIERSS